MKQTYEFEYLNENDFRKKERSVKKYNMLAYKKLLFDFYPKLKSGNFLGEMVASNKEEKTNSYELELPADEMFKKIHGPIILHYTVYKDRQVVFFTNITPEEILLEGHNDELITYKGVMVSKLNREKDMFKINLLDMLKK